jgi:hypothetical protein
MKKLISTLLFSLPMLAMAQLTTTSPDTVCYQSTSLSNYQVPSIGSGTYTWTVPSCATLVSGQGTNSIQVNWSACPPGLITNAITVTYSSAAPANCPATPVTLNVLIYQAIPTIQALGPFCESDPCVTLVGSPAGGTWSGLGVSGNQFCSDAVANGTNAVSTVTYTVGSAGCTFSASTTVPVYGTPTLSPIQHN